MHASTRSAQRSATPRHRLNCLPLCGSKRQGGSAGDCSQSSQAQYPPMNSRTTAAIQAARPLRKGAAGSSQSAVIAQTASSATVSPPSLTSNAGRSRCSMTVRIASVPSTSVVSRRAGPRRNQPASSNSAQHSSGRNTESPLAQPPSSVPLVVGAKPLDNASRQSGNSPSRQSRCQARGMSERCRR